MEADEFERCWHDNVRRVTAYAERHVGRDACYDIVSATFVVAWRTWERVPDPALPLLIATARGQIRNHRRSLRRQQSLQERIALLDSAAYDGPDVAAIAAERAEALATLAAMPAGDREALLLVAWEGLTPEQAADVLGCRPGTLRTRVHRARRRLDAVTSDTTQPILRTAP